jgi:hypothetical protein
MIFGKHYIITGMGIFAVFHTIVTYIVVKIKLKKDKKNE